MIFNKLYYLNLIVWLILGNLFSISLVENRYQKNVIPSIVETYNDQLSLIKEELHKEKIRKEEPEKLLCYSRTEILELVMNNTDRGDKP